MLFLFLFPVQVPSRFGSGASSSLCLCLYATSLRHSYEAAPRTQTHADTHRHTRRHTQTRAARCRPSVFLLFSIIFPGPRHTTCKTHMDSAVRLRLHKASNRHHCRIGPLWVSANKQLNHKLFWSISHHTGVRRWAIVRLQWFIIH